MCVYTYQNVSSTPGELDWGLSEENFSAVFDFFLTTEMSFSKKQTFYFEIIADSHVVMRNNREILYPSFTQFPQRQSQPAKRQHNIASTVSILTQPGCGTFPSLQGSLLL